MESYRDSRMQIEIYNGGRQTPISNMYGASVHPPNYPQMKMKKGGSSSNSKIWSLNDPELQRKKRIASYKVYTVERKMKVTLRKSFTWIKGMVSGRR